MTKNTKRIPNAKGFEATIPKIVKIKKEKVAVAEKTENLLFSAPPVNYVFNSKTFQDMTKNVLKATLSVEGYPLCCGAMNVFGFPNFRTEREADNLIKKSVEKSQQSLKGMVTAITNDRQEREGWDKILKKNGFIPVFKSSNPNHVNATVITLWCLNLGSRDFSKEYKSIEKNIDTGLGSGRASPN